MEALTITDDHLALLRRMYIGWDDMEYGAPAVDGKRPYGNSDVPGDICEILGWPYDEDEGVDVETAKRCRTIHEEMRLVLQQVVRTWQPPQAATE